ncbi:MAG: hypothetical protein N2376_08080, partial [Clostridia bacterium]|nr:hypothetical protein [Clostridia bacterium]
MKHFRKTTTLLLTTAVIFTGRIMLDLNAAGQETQPTISEVELLHTAQSEPTPVSYTHLRAH